MNPNSEHVLTFDAFLKIEMEKQGLKQQDIVKKSGVDDGNLCRIVTGKAKRISLHTAKAIVVDGLGLSMGVLDRVVL